MGLYVMYLDELCRLYIKCGFWTRFLKVEFSIVEFAMVLFLNPHVTVVRREGKVGETISHASLLICNSAELLKI